MADGTAGQQQQQPGSKGAGAGAQQQDGDGAPPVPEPVKLAGDEVKGPENARALEAREEAEALDYLLSSKGPMAHRIPVTIATPAGDRTIRWRVHQMDGRELEAIEKRHMSDGPLGELDEMAASAELVAEATTYPDVRSAAFRTPPATQDEPNPAPDASAADAIRRVFRYQSGIIPNLAGAIRNVSGWSGDRVGTAQRDLLDAAGNS